MPVRHHSVQLSIAAVCFSATILTAHAQLPSPVGCATQPEPESSHVRAVAGTCGSAVFQIDARQRQLGALRLVVGGNLYVRVIRLVYRSSNGTAQQETQMPLHRLLVEGEASEPIPTTRSGLSLVSLAVDVNPPGYGVGPVPMELIGPTDSAPAATKIEDGRTTSEGFMLIGSVVAHVAESSDTIIIGREKGRFDGIVIGSRGNDLSVQSVQISPFNGVPFSIDVRNVITPGTEGAVIPIEPPDFLHQITVTYGTQPSASRQPILEVRGHYAENWLGRLGDNRNYAGGWVLLGTADIVASPHRAAQRDNFRIAGQEGPFKKLRFVARRGALSLISVAVDIGDGRQETLPLNALLVPDVQSAAVTLQSGAVPIGSVVLTPRVAPSSRIDATVEVWAQY
jgi:hypothetical protein